LSRPNGERPQWQAKAQEAKLEQHMNISMTHDRMLAYITSISLSKDSTSKGAQLFQK